MKVGDKYDVTIAGQVVAQAEVRELADGTATLIVPGTKVVMATRTDIAPEPVNISTEGASTIIEGVDRVNDAGEVVSSTETQTQSAPVPAPVENTQQTPVPQSSDENAQQVVETAAAPVTPEPVQEVSAEVSDEQNSTE